MALLDRSEFDRWQAEAGRALGAARVEAEAGFHNWACFTAEQAAQLALKALLHGLGRGPWGHDLVRLGEAAAEAVGAGWGGALEAALRSLSRHYIPARYPDAHAEGPSSRHYGAEDSRQALEHAGEILAAVDRAWERLLAADEAEERGDHGAGDEGG